MHDKNPYSINPPDFNTLATTFPAFGKYTSKDSFGNCKVDWTDSNAGRELTLALLEKDFNVKLEIPNDHLCPPLPNRINYLCWLSDLIQNNTCRSKISNEPKDITICDIGVGPLCIYPILGNKLFSWKFIGTDIDPRSIQWAQRNVSTDTTLERVIQLYHVSNSDHLQTLIVEKYLPQFLAVKEATSNVPAATQTSSSSSSSGGIKPSNDYYRIGAINNVDIDSDCGSDEDEDDNTAVYISNPTVSDAVAAAASSRLRDLALPLTMLDTVRGPISSALHAMGGKHAEYLAEIEQQLSMSEGEAPSDREPCLLLFDAVMTNPPFYDSNEQVKPS